MKSILDSSFRYTSSEKTDLKKTFARIRRIQREIQAAQCEADDEAKNKVVTIGRKKARVVTGVNPM